MTITIFINNFILRKFNWVIILINFAHLCHPADTGLSSSSAKNTHFKNLKNNKEQLQLMRKAKK